MRLLALLSFLFLLSCQSTEQEKLSTNDALVRPAPTTGTLVHYGEEIEGRGDQRRAWEAKLHKAAPGVDWQEIELTTSLERHQVRTALRRQGVARSGQVSLASGQVEGQWVEKGSTDQAGSLLQTAYNITTDAITAVASGGSLWRLDLETEEWALLNQELRFERGLLQVIQQPADSLQQRVLATIAAQPMYSDDGGISWSEAVLESNNPVHDWSRIYRAFVANDGLIYLMAKLHSSSKSLVVSEDGGETYQVIRSFTENNPLIDISQPHHTDDLLLAQESGDSIKIFKVMTGDTVLQLLQQSADLTNTDQPLYKLLSTMLPDSSLKLMTYDDDRIYQSLDSGLTWTSAGILNQDPWSVGIYLSKSNPEALLLGNVELHYSHNNGSNWNKVANWWEYYDNVPFKIHADVMYIEEYLRPDGQYYTYVCNHGGLNVSTEDPLNYFNLGLYGLNVSQYYSTITQPGTEDRIYAGTQDQGLQFSSSNGAGPLPFDQVISGDYGNLSYSHSSQAMYAMYPFGSLTKWNTIWEENMGWYDVESENEFVWITPFMVVPDATSITEETVYVAGGSADNGPGSYLIKVTDIDPSEFDANFVDENLPFNFLNADGNGQLTQVAYSSLDNNRFYTATEDGRFYHSNDAGLNWEQTINFLPQGYYLYGQAILPSRVDSNRVWFGGSGYSNPAIYQSDDAGENFVSISEGLPPTVVLRLVANNDESLLFAATEAGPYVYVVAEGSWYDLSGLDAPAGRYYSVEWLPESEIARFSTYNRGIWDFEVATEVSSIATQRKPLPNWSAYPNPTSGPLQTDRLPADAVAISIMDLSGKRLARSTAAADLSQLAAGVYLLAPVDEAGRLVGKVKRVVRE